MDSSDMSKTGIDWICEEAVRNKPPILSFSCTNSEKMVRKWNWFSGKTVIRFDFGHVEFKMSLGKPN